MPDAFSDVRETSRSSRNTFFMPIATVATFFHSRADFLDLQKRREQPDQQLYTVHANKHSWAHFR